MSPDRLLIRLETRGQREALGHFLRRRRLPTRSAGETSLAIEVLEGSPPLATIVATVEQWRRGCCVVVLELAGRRTVLRTET